MRSTFSSAFNTILEYPAMESPFSPTFENIHLEYRAVSSIFGSAFKISFELRAIGSTYGSAFENTNVEYRAVGPIFICALNTIHTLNIELLVDIQHCIRKYSSRTLSYEIDVQLCIQHPTRFEYRAMRSAFSSAFENILPEYGAVGSTFSSTFNTKLSLNIELLGLYLALHSKTFILNIELCSQYSDMHSKSYTICMV